MTPRRRQGSGSGGGAPGSALAVGGHAGAEASAKTMAGWRRPSSISLPRGASTGDREDDAASPAPPQPAFPCQPADYRVLSMLPPITVSCRLTE